MDLIWQFLFQPDVYLDKQEMTQKGSKSSDILDAASNNSPLGRTTDLDQAMKQRDEEKLRKLFMNSETLDLLMPLSAL
jgi:hypothetical protein